MAAGLAGLLAACAGPLAPPPPASPAAAERADDRELWTLAPADAAVLLWVDLAQVRASRWTRDALASASPSERQRRIDERGFDDAVDVDLLLLARSGDMPEGESLVAWQGRFDRTQVTAAFRRRFPEAAPLPGVPLGLVGGAEAVAFLTDRTVLTGPAAAVRAAIACGFGRARGASDQDWLSELRSALVEGRGTGPRAALEVAVRLDDEMRMKVQEELGDGEALERFGARLELGEALALEGVGLLASPNAAAALSRRIESAVGELRRRPSVAAIGLASVLDGLRIGARGSRVTADVHLSEAQREEIAERLAAIAQALSAGDASTEP